MFDFVVHVVVLVFILVESILRKVFQFVTGEMVRPLLMRVVLSLVVDFVVVSSDGSGSPWKDFDLPLYRLVETYRPSKAQLETY